MKIAHLHWAYPPTTGGVESHLAELVRVQGAAGHDVMVVTGEPEPDPAAGCTIISTDLLALDSIRDRGAPTDFARRLRSTLASLLGNGEIEIVHAHDLHHFTPEPALALTDLRARLGFALHHSFHETWPDVLQDTPVYRGWDGNYAVSRFVRDGCATRLGFRPLLMPLGINVERFRCNRAPFDGSEPATLLHPARLLPWKGVHVSIRMLDILRARGLRPRLVLTDTQRIADWDDELGTYRAAIALLVDELDLRDHVTFETAAFAEMPRLYELADIVLYPTVGDEPFGLVPLEAMSSSRPIVASRSGGIMETIVPGQTGFVVERGDAEGLADAVEMLISRPDLARAIGRAGREHVRERYDIHAYAHRLDGFYQASLVDLAGV